MKAVVIFSGGLDSTVALFKAVEEVGAGNVEAVSFFYGQRHEREITAARDILKYTAIPHTVVDLVGHGSMRGVLPAAFMVGGALTDGTPVPHGHYEAPSMKQTVVPNRNMVFIALAAAKLMQYTEESCMFLYTGVHAGDHAIYPDCRRPFILHLLEAVNLMSEDRITLIAPFLRVSKADIVRQGAILHVPFEKTWSCYEGGDVHCGKCGTCVERREAFEKAIIADPTVYAS